MNIFTGLSEFKFYQSFRMKVETADNLRFLLERIDEFGKTEYVQDAQLIDISVTGLGFRSKDRLSLGVDVNISLQFKKMHLDLTLHNDGSLLQFAPYVHLLYRTDAYAYLHKVRNIQEM